MKRNSLIRLFSGMKDIKKQVFTSLIFALIASVAGLISPIINGRLIDVISDGVSTGAVISIKTVLAFFGIQIFIVLLKMVMSGFQTIVMSDVTKKITHNLRKQINEKLDRLPMSYFYNNTTGSTLSLMINDVDMIAGNLNQSVVNIVEGVITLSLGTVIMLVMNVYLTIVCFLVIALGVILITVITKKSKKSFAMSQGAVSSLNSLIEENLSGMPIVNSFNKEARSLEKFEEKNAICNKYGFKAQSLSGIVLPMSIFTTFFNCLCISVVGFIMHLKGQTEIGTVVSFVGLSNNISQPVRSVSQSLQTLVGAFASADRIYKMLDEDEMEDESGKQSYEPDVTGDIAFEHIRFGYNPDNTVIHDFSLSVAGGQKIAIVGPTGAGKSTIINLLMRFYETDGGNIFIDGTNIRDLKREDLRALFSMVLQEPWVFRGSIRENIIYSTKNVTQEKLDKAVSAVGLDYFVKTLPDGYDTVLGSGFSISQGQKQQISIARALVSDRPMVILDEATSSIDTRTEKKIQEAMDILMQGRTSFVIAHRLSTIKNADCILVLKDGDIVECGRHDELLMKNGFYAGLYNSQFG